MAACGTGLEIFVLFCPLLIRCGENFFRILSGEVQSTVLCIIRGSGITLLGSLGSLHLFQAKIAYVLDIMAARLCKICSSDNSINGCGGASCKRP